MKYCKVCHGFRKNSADNRCLECNEHSLISKSDRVNELGELVNQLIERTKSEGEGQHFIKELEEINKICQEFKEIQRIEEENEIIVKKIAEELIDRAKEIINQQNQNRARQIVISSFRENGELSKLIAKELEIKLKELQKELGAKLESLPGELKGELGLEVERMFGRGIENLANNLTERVNIDNLTSAQSDVASLYKQLIEDLKAGHEEYKLTKESLIKEVKDAKNQIQEELRSEQIEHNKTKQVKEKIINEIKQILDLAKTDLLIENWENRLVKRTELLQEQEAHELSKKNYHSLQDVHFSLEEELKTEKDNYLKTNLALVAEQLEHKKTKEELALEKEKAQKNQEKAEKDRIEAEKAIHSANEEKEVAIGEKNKAEVALDKCKKIVDELKKQLTEKTSENNELVSQIEEKNKQIKELQNNNDLISEETNKMRVFLENYKEYLYAKVQDADDTLSEEIFNEEQKQEIAQEKQEYEAKIVQVEQFIRKVNK